MCAPPVCRMYHRATVAVLRSRSWQVRKRAQQMVKKLLSALGGSGLAHGLLGELSVVVSKHAVRRRCTPPQPRPGDGDVPLF